MPRIMITCPATHKPIYTGMSMARESFEEDSNAFSNTGTVCPECGEIHKWQGQDAYLEGDETAV